MSPIWTEKVCGHKVEVGLNWYGGGWVTLDGNLIDAWAGRLPVGLEIEIDGRKVSPHKERWLFFQRPVFSPVQTNTMPFFGAQM